MKQRNNIFYIVALIIGVVFIAVGFTGVMTQLTAFRTNELPREKYIEVPTFGYLKCLPNSEQTFKSDSFGAEQKVIKCEDYLGMNNGCSITLIPPDKSALVTRTYAYGVQRNGVGNVNYKEIPNGEFGYSGRNDEIQIEGGLSRNDILYLRYGTGALAFGLIKENLLNEGQSFTVLGQQYGLFDVNDLSSSNGQLASGARPGNCFLDLDFYKNRQIQQKSPEISELQGVALDYSSLNKPNGVYTYFKGFQPMPGFAQQIETVNDKEAYCMNSALYSTMQIVVNGFTYNIVNYEKGGFIKNVVCCNGDQKPGYTCVNHNYVLNEKTECDLSKGIFCPQSTFQPYGDSSYKRFSCENKKCILEVIKVDCNDNDDCGNKVCVRNDDPKRNVCVESGSGTTITPGTLPKEHKEQTNYLIPLLILILGLIISGLIIYLRRRKKF